MDKEHSHQKGSDKEVVVELDKEAVVELDKEVAVVELGKEENSQQYQ